MHLILARHGETIWNTERRIQGWTNSPLSDLGLKQIKLLGERLADLPFAAVFSSDTERAEQTALTVIGGRDIPYQSLTGLRETSWGLWEGKTALEIALEQPDLWAQFVERIHHHDPEFHSQFEATTLVPEGETVLQASQRINASVNFIIEQYRASDHWVLVVGHGGSLRFVIARLLGLRPSASRLFHLDNASVTHFSIDPERTILNVLNDSSHWSGTLIK